MNSMKNRFLENMAHFCEDSTIQDTLFVEVEKYYRKKSRAYHNLIHIETMLDLADDFISELEDPALLKISIWYHDLIYNALRKDNELKSAEHVKAVLGKLNCEPKRILRCYHQILSTKNHQVAKEEGTDEKLLIDFDLEILSRNWTAYERYTQQIRKEYWMYPGPIYRKGRREAMLHFLERDRIYQTDFFRENKEKQARENIVREIELLK